MKTNSNSTRTFLRGLAVVLLSTTMLTSLFSQDVVIQSAGTFSGSGTYKVKGNISNSGVGAAKTINGTVTFDGAGAQAIGTATNGAINFQTLNVTPSVVATTTLNVASAVSTAVNIGTAGTAATLAVGTHSLDIGGTSALVNGSSALTTAASSTVTFSSAGAGQVVLGGFAYSGNLILSGGTKTLNAATVTSVGQAFDASGAGLLTFSNGGLTLGTTGTFASVSNSATIKNGSALAQFGAVTNTGTIDGTNGGGALTFNSTVGNNGGTITGGAGLATFSGLLTQTATGILTSGGGGLTLTAGLTNTLGNITVGAGQSMAISGGQFAYTAGTLSFNATSTVTYGASATTIVDAAYGHLTLNSDPKTWTLAAGRTVSGNLTLGASAATTVGGAFALNVNGNISLGSNLTKSANAVVFTNEGSGVSGTGYEIVGSVTRTHTFTASSAYTFNNASMILTPTVVGTLSSFTLTSQPGVNPTGYLAGNSVNRNYSKSFTGAGFTATVQLAYLGAEYTGSNASKIKEFQGGIAKVNKLAGTYTRNSANGFNYVSLPGLTTLTSGSELGLDDRYNVFISVAVNDWDQNATWDMSSVPTASDDVEIAGAYAVTIPTGVSAAAASVLIDQGTTAGGLTLAGTATLAVGTGGLTNNNTTGTGLTVPAGANNVTITGGNLTNNGTITNAGTVTVQ